MANRYINPWTCQHEDFLNNNYENLGPKKCAEALGRTIKAIYTKAHVLKLKIGKEYS